MSNELYEGMKQILKLPYFKNEHAHSGKYTQGHEQVVSKVLTHSGFKEIHRSKFPKLKKNILKKWEETEDISILNNVLPDMEEGSYILQPAGTQSFPDILLKDFGSRFVFIECKSITSGGTPMWNDNLPKPKAIYILSSGKENATTVFLGKDVITESTINTQKEMIKKIKELVNNFKHQTSEQDIYKRGWYIKVRPQNFQEGGAAQTNYFTHPDRILCENNVLEYSKL